MLVDFFERNTLPEDKEYIKKHFARGGQGFCADEDNFWWFINVLNEYRNAAAHEGQYWDTCFNNCNEHCSGRAEIATAGREK